ncbi:hypothetical protein [Streptomyces sp. bgisy031]|uniref:hypothetical protein n=1 Tax=Streptomyces sp. bgisy031 TaxID=3413772 RepID=UPI003D763D66
MKLNFVLPRFMPGDPALSSLKNIQQQTGAVPTAAAVKAVRLFYGDPTRNLFQQYLKAVQRDGRVRRPNWLPAVGA